MFSNFVHRLRSGQPVEFPSDSNTIAFARRLDHQDDLAYLRDEFVLPSKKSLKKTSLDGSVPGMYKSSGYYANQKNKPPQSYMTTLTYITVQTTLTTGTAENEERELSEDETSLYFVGNSLGAQPKAVRRCIEAQLETWASLGVKGHVTPMENSPLNPWQDLAEDCARKSASMIGASPDEIVIMNTLSVNLHLLMASFYKPTQKRNKIILEWKPFPSDHYIIESQIAWHGFDPLQTMIKIEPDCEENAVISTDKILRVIIDHAEDAALILLPGVQYYSGQLFDMAKITAHAKARGIIVGWDLAHAVGNVELKLHDWNVDFASWCTYKYINAGPGAIAGAFIHEKYGQVEYPTGPDHPPRYWPRLAGWYGGDKSVRFNMDNLFVPTAGAAGYQASNPSAIDLASLSGALSVFEKTSMHQLRSKSLLMTAYAEYLLDAIALKFAESSTSGDETIPPFLIITPRDPLQRGAQISVLLRNEGLVASVASVWDKYGVVCDTRKPNVVRVAPVPLYTRFADVWRFMQLLEEALSLGETKVDLPTRIV